MESTVTVRGQTAIPVALRRRYNIQPGARLVWLDDGHSISVLPASVDSVAALRGRLPKRDLNRILRRERHRDRTRG